MLVLRLMRLLLREWVLRPPVARIRLVASGSADREMLSDANGSFAFLGVPPGTYELRERVVGVYLPSYATVSFTYHFRPRVP